MVFSQADVTSKAMTSNQITNKMTFILTFATALLLSCEQVQDKQNSVTITASNTNKMNDIERLLDSTFPFVEELLMEHGEFFPLASAVKTNDSIAQVGTYDGDEKPLSNTVIEDLKAAFRAKKDDYKTIAIFYDVRVVDPNTNQKTDAVAVFVETKIDITAYTVYYPYILTTDGELSFSDAWKNASAKEIFND